VALTLSPDTVCDLYEKDGTYRLIATVSDSKTDILASEYGFEITQNSIAIESTKEGYHCLISDRALEVLGGLFSEK
jgi:DNA primase catalytic subunit